MNLESLEHADCVWIEALSKKADFDGRRFLQRSTATVQRADGPPLRAFSLNARRRRTARFDRAREGMRHSSNPDNRMICSRQEAVLRR
jgi:hypothetical protein